MLGYSQSYVEVESSLQISFPLIAVKYYAKAGIKYFWCCLILLDFFILSKYFVRNCNSK